MPDVLWVRRCPSLLFLSEKNVREGWGNVGWVSSPVGVPEGGVISVLRAGGWNRDFSKYGGRWGVMVGRWSGPGLTREACFLDMVFGNEYTWSALAAVVLT